MESPGSRMSSPSGLNRLMINGHPRILLAAQLVSTMGLKQKGHLLRHCHLVASSTGRVDQASIFGLGLPVCITRNLFEPLSVRHGHHASLTPDRARAFSVCSVTVTPKRRTASIIDRNSCVISIRSPSLRSWHIRIHGRGALA